MLTSPRSVGLTVRSGRLIGAATVNSCARLRRARWSSPGQLGRINPVVSWLAPSAATTPAGVGFGFGFCFGFGSRHDDRLTMWAIFEQPGEDATGSHRLSEQLSIELSAGDPELLEAFDVFGLSWST